MYTDGDYLAGAQRLSAWEAAVLPGLDGWTRSALAILTSIGRGNLVITFPDGRRFRFDGAQPGKCGVIDVHDMGFSRKLLSGGGIGFADAYLNGLWNTPDLRTLLTVIAQNNDYIGARLRGNFWLRMFELFRHTIFHRNSRVGSRRNIEYHYDLGNAFYEQWLDSTMTYSSAMFTSKSETLEQAQRNKFMSLAHGMGLSKDHALLEVGCGWGGFAEFAATEIGCSVTGITISPAQFEYAKRRISETGLNDKVSIILQDYRDVSGSYDRIASIEMFEAVGEKYWPLYFRKIHDALKPGGAAGLQIIAIADRHFNAYRRGNDFIQRYIFPGGMLPSPSALREQITAANLIWRSSVSFGADYADTLSRWHDRFAANWPHIARLGFDGRFKRMWCYYLAYCEGGFRSGNTDVMQITLARV